MYFSDDDPRSWFDKPQTGLFVHWGLYAVHGIHEQERNRFHVVASEYEKLVDVFNPKHFNPHEWIDLAQEAGMTYIVFTVKHGDGFCLWDTKTTRFNIMQTPYQRDILCELATACHQRHFPLCLYFCPFDNHCPYRNNLIEGDDGVYQPDINKQMAYVKEQIRELCTQYGTIHGFWFDVGHDGIIDPSINLMIRKLQPAVVINNRGFGKGDFSTPERNYNENEYGPMRSFTSLVEACESIGMTSWGFKYDEDYFTSRHLMREIDKTLSRGGNYLLNVGPEADGNMPDQCITILKKIGKWFQTVKESYTNAQAVSDWISNEDIYLTRRGDTIYVHLNGDVKGSMIEMKELLLEPKRAILLNTEQAVRAERNSGCRHYNSKNENLLNGLRIRDLPTEDFYDQVMIVRMEYDQFSLE